VLADNDAERARSQVLRDRREAAVQALIAADAAYAANVLEARRRAQDSAQDSAREEEITPGESGVIGDDPTPISRV
jgi:hypothetical protein